MKQQRQSKELLREDFDTQLTAKNDHSFRNNINESNYEFCKEMSEVWRKAERAVDEKETEKSKEIFKKGKELLENRMQAIIIGDKEGWDIALGYVSDPLVKTAEQEKRLKKARR